MGRRDLRRLPLRGQHSQSQPALRLRRPTPGVGPHVTPRGHHPAGVSNYASFEANAILAGELLAAVADASAPVRVILVGSAAEYGIVPASAAVPETHPCAPRTEYGVAKYA